LKFYNEEKQFGFIHYGAGEEIFLHQKGLNPACFHQDGSTVLCPGDWVSFEIGMTSKGRVAVNVQKLCLGNEGECKE
jgi:cold shock CspA family protein